MRTVELTPLELCAPFRNTDQGLLVTAIRLLCILRCADQNVWVAHSLAPYDSREFRYPNHQSRRKPRSVSTSFCKISHEHSRETIDLYLVEVQARFSNAILR